MSSEAISGVSNIGLSNLAAARGVSVNDLVARTQNARASGGLNISQLITQKREAIQNTSVDQLLTPEKRQKLQELQGKLNANKGTVENKKKFQKLAEEIEAAARQNLNAGKAGAFGGSRFLSSNINALGVTGTQAATSGTTAQVDVLELATSSQGALIRIGGEGGREIRAAAGSNKFESDVTELTGVTIDAKQITRVTETKTVVDLTKAGAVEGFDKKDNTVKLSKTASATIGAGDAVEVQFSKGLAGLSPSQTFFLARANKKDKDGREFEVFATEKDALAGKNAIDLSDVVGGQINTAREAVKSIRSELNNLRPGKDDLVGGFEQAQKGIADIRKNLVNLRSTFDGKESDLEDAISELETADRQLADATGRVNGRKNANDALNSVSGSVKGFLDRVKTGEDLNPDTVIASLRAGIDKLSKEFGAVPEGQEKEVQKALKEVLKEFGALGDTEGDGGDDRGDDRGGDKISKQFKSNLQSLSNKLETLGGKFQTKSNQADNRAISSVSETLTDERIALRRIANDRGDGNNITVRGIDVSTVKRTTKTVTTDNTVTVQVLQDPETARKSIEALTQKITEAVNLVENDKVLKKDLAFSKAATGLRRAFNEIVGVSEGAITSSGTSNALTVDSAKLSQVLENEGTFRKFEFALQRRGGAAFQLINTTTGSARGLESNITAQVKQQAGLESQIEDLTAEAEETRKNLMSGLKDIATASLAAAGTQNSSKAEAGDRLSRKQGSNSTPNFTKAAGFQQNGLQQGLSKLTAATTNVVGSKSFIQSIGTKFAQN